MATYKKIPLRDWALPLDIEVLDTTQPHTLADFVAETLKHGIVVEGLPDGMGVDQVEKKFGNMNDVYLKLITQGYFSGWFEPGIGRRVITVDGAHLFSIFPTLGHFVLKIEPAALELLKKVS